MACWALWNTTSNESFHSNVLSDIECMYSTNCTLLYFGHFLAENIFSINLKVHFLRWCVGHYKILSVMNRSILMYYLKWTSCIQLKYQKKYAKCIFCYEKFSADEQKKNLN